MCRTDYTQAKAIKTTHDLLLTEYRKLMNKVHVYLTNLIDCTTRKRRRKYV